MTPLFSYGAIRESAWYRRFFCAEYRIRLNGEPPRHLIIDEEVDQALPADLRRGYEDKIRELFLHSPDFDKLTPWDLLLRLRDIKGEVLPPESLGGTKRAGEEDSGAGEQRIELTPLSLTRNRSLLYLCAHPEGAAEARRWFAGAPGQKHILARFRDPRLRGLPLEAQRKLLAESGAEPLLLSGLPLSQQDKELIADHTRRGALVAADGLWAMTAGNSLLEEGLIEELLLTIRPDDWLTAALLGCPQDNTPSRGTERTFSSEPSPEKPAGPRVRYTALMTSPFPYPFPTGTEMPAISLLEYLQGKEPRSLEARRQEQNAFLRSFPASLEGGVLVFDNRLKQEKSAVRRGETTMVSLIKTGAGTITPRFYREPVLPPLPDTEEESLHDSSLCGSFSYYFTESLRFWYNRLVPAPQRITEPNLPIDYIGLFDSRVCPEGFESLPLFSKALLGCARDGSLFAGHYPLEEAILRMEERSYRFGAADINPATPPSRPALYLPSFAGTGAAEETTTEVGEKRFCLVTIQDRIIYQGPGPCIIPPLGCVVTLPEPPPEPVSAFRWESKLKGLPRPKKALRWLVGGFNLLYKGGKNYYPSPEEGAKSLRREGWSHPRSMASQETQLLADVRQPRCALGQTSTGRVLLFTVAGRTGAGKGATFTELVHLGKRLAGEEDLDFLINLDGGASAGITACRNGQGQTLGVTAPSPDNSAGLPRPLPTYLELRLNTKEKL